MKVILLTLSIVFNTFSVDRHFRKVLLLDKDTINNPAYLVGFNADGDTMGITDIDSLESILVPDSVAKAGHADNADSLNGLTSDDFLKLDQTTPQTVINGIPNFNLGVNSGNYYYINGGRVISIDGTYNLYLGDYSGIAGTTHNYNLGVGVNTLRRNTTGYSNIALAANALAYNTEGYYIVAIGGNAVFSNTKGCYITAVGRGSLYNLNSSTLVNMFDVAIGGSAMAQLTTGKRNCGIGDNVLALNTTGSDNSVVGYLSFYGTSGMAVDKNASIGAYAGYGAANGCSMNLLAGYYAGFSIGSGSGDVFLGPEAGYYETGSNKFYLSNSKSNDLLRGDFSTHTIGIPWDNGYFTLGAAADAGFAYDGTNLVYNSRLVGAGNHNFTGGTVYVENIPASEKDTVVIDSAGVLKKRLADSLSVKHAAHADSADKCDTCNVSFKALYTTHGVDSSYIPVATTDTTFGNSTAKMAGDTFTIYKDFSVGDTFVDVGYYGFFSYVSTFGICTAPNDDVYSSQLWSSGTITRISKQAGGTGNFAIVDTIPGAGCDLSADKAGNIYAINFDASILYKRTGGTGQFDSIWDFGAYKGYASATDTAGNLYVVGDDVYVMENGGSIFTALSTGLTGLLDVTGLPNGDMLITNGSGDVYRITFGAITPINQNVTPSVYSLCTDTSGNVYGSGGGVYGYIWIMVGGNGDFYLYENKQRSWGDMTCLNNGTLRTYTSQFYERDASPEITAFKVKQGASVFGGSVGISGNLLVEGSTEIENTPLTEDPSYLMVKKDNDIIKAFPPDSLVVDSARVAGTLAIGALTGTFRISNDTLFIKTTATDSLCFKAVTP